MRADGIILAALLLGAGTVWGQQAPAASGEKKAKHVITEEDLEGSRPADQQSSSSSEASAKKPAEECKEGEECPEKETDQAAAKAGGSASEEEEEKKRQEQIEQLKRDEGAQQRNIDKMQKQLEETEDPTRQEIFREAVANGQRALGNLQAERQKLEDEQSKAKAAKEGQGSEAPPQ